MAAQAPFNVGYEIQSLVASLTDTEKYVVQNIGQDFVEYTDAADADAAKSLSWKRCEAGAFFILEVDAAEPTFVRAPRRPTVLAISDE